MVTPATLALLNEPFSGKFHRRAALVEKSEFKVSWYLFEVDDPAGGILP